MELEIEPTSWGLIVKATKQLAVNSTHYEIIYLDKNDTKFLGKIYKFCKNNNVKSLSILKTHFSQDAEIVPLILEVLVNEKKLIGG